MYNYVRMSTSNYEFYWSFYPLREISTYTFESSLSKPVQWGMLNRWEKSMSNQGHLYLNNQIQNTDVY